MSIRLYFPTIGKDSEPNILWQLSSCEDGQPGEIYLDKELCDIPDRNKTFWNPIKRAAECGAVRLTARGVKGVDYKEKLAGSSASGCAEFFRQYDCNGSKKNLNVAVSIHSECWNDAEQVSDVKAKIEFCRKEGMDLLLLPEKNFPGDIEATRLSDMDGVPENMSDRNMLILLAGEGWTKQLARLLEVPPRGERETTADEQTSHEDTRRLYEIYLEALSSGEEGEEMTMLREIFRQSHVDDREMKENTFPSKALDGEDEDGRPCRDIVFQRGSAKKPHLLFVGSTSTGKTTLAKALLLNALFMGVKAVYISPTRALVYEVYEDFMRMLKDMRQAAENLGSDYRNLLEYFIHSETDDGWILCSTGERGEQDGQILRDEYRIIFSVYEKANLFMNIMLDKAADRQPGLIVIDELHMLMDEQRGGILDLFMAKVQDSARPARIIGITTEKEGAATLREFLRKADEGDAQRRPAPSIISIPYRPCAVEHYLLLGHCESRIAVFDSQQVPVLSHFKGRTLVQQLVRKYKEEDNEPFRYVDMLEKRGPDKKPHAKVLAVFNSIAHIYSVMEKLIDSRKQGNVKWTDGEANQKSKDAGESKGTAYCDEKTLDRIHKKLAVSLVSTEEREKLWKGAHAGIFVYYSPMDYDLREVMAKAFREDGGGSEKKTQVLLTTEALAYGVNLPADAVYLTYIRDLEGNILKKNVFFNLLGRVGRLGKNSSAHQCAYIVSMEQDAARAEQELSEALKLYENDDDEFRPQTFNEQDFFNLMPERDAVEALDDIAFPTFRSALDALRFTVARKERNMAAPRHVRAHLSRSFFGWYQRYRQDVENDEMEKVLQKLYELIAHAPGFEKNKLVCEENGSFSCTELASALIDTGTSWKAIQPMIRWLERISRLDVYRKLPVELLLVGMLPVGELWELIRRFDQQAGKFTVSVSPESEDWARRALAGELKLLDESLPVEQLLKAIDEYLEKCCGNLELSDKKQSEPLSHAARRSSFFRLLAALLRWVRGASSDEIQKLASPYEGRADFSLSFSSRYGDRASWLCILCLRFFSKTEGVKLCPEHEGALQNLALRMRYGVPRDCIPLMGMGNARISRTEVLKYMRLHAITLKKVMQLSYEEYTDERKIIPLRPSSEFTKLKRNAELYYLRAAEDFGWILMKRGNMAAQNAWKSLKSCLKNPETASNDKIAGALRDIVSGNGFDCRVTNDGRELVIRQNGVIRELVLSILNVSSRRENQDDFVEYISSLQRKVVLCVWMPWKNRHDLPDPDVPAVGIMSAMLILRMMDPRNMGVENIYEWLSRQKKAGKRFFRIQQLIGDTDDAIKDLRDYLPGEVLQGVLQMEEAFFPDKQ